MNWNNTILQDFRWTTKISNEEAKKAIASKIAEFVSDGDVI
jgi:DeoR/GlpR family transcriptional regulator of sugar metabolism